MDEIWAEIDAWLQAEAPLAYASLRPGATPQALADMEAQLGIPVPLELRQSLAIHDGQNRQKLCGLLDGWIFLSSASIAKTHATFARLLQSGDLARHDEASSDGTVKQRWWDNGWIPFLVSPGGDYLCCDMDPPAWADVGQIITFLHDDGPRRVRAASLAELLAEFASDLQSGSYEVDEDGGLWPAE